MTLQRDTATATPKRSDSWLPISTLARVFDLSDQGFRVSVLAYMPEAAVRKGRPILCHGRTAMEVWASRETPQDPMSGDGSSSPALERFRLARAEREELELSVRRGQLIDLDEFLSWYGAEVAGPIRKGLERLQLAHGKAAVALVLEGVSRAERAIEKRGAMDDE